MKRFYRRWICAFLLAGLSLPLGAVPTSAAGSSGSAAPRASTGFAAAALYNQANTFARHGQIGQAVLHYEQALLLAPADADIAANLQAVRAKAGLPEVPPSAMDRALTPLAPDTMAWLGCGGLLLAGVGALLSRLQPERGRTFRVMVGAGALLMAGMMGNALVLWPKIHEAVVFVPNAPAWTAPAAAGDPAFTLREGEMVSIRATRQRFLLIRTAAGRSGWVARGEIARVVPVIGETAAPARQT
ncbi:MAG: tetratricopeptide repeat protein [Opitutaceae bacterium]